MKRISLFLLIIIYLSNNNASCQKIPLKFRFLTTDEGLSSSSVTSILQDSKGFIWIGTYDGLNRYDGYNFVQYKNSASDSTSISHNLIWNKAYKQLNPPFFNVEGARNRGY